MQKTNILSNIPIEELNDENDYFGLLEKGRIIKTFIIGSKNSFNEIKMFSLYGDWGSGKSSLMKSIKKELSTDFNTFFFEAWEYEKDENLAMSLLEFITHESKSTSEEFYKDVLKYGSRILGGIGKSIKLKIPFFINGAQIEVDPSNLVEELSQKDDLTFYDALKKFKTDFKRLEDYITRGDNPKLNIVFIDDLDRCEPEQVLNLLSAIKLFFTYGEKTIFFCAIDKSAVEAAVKTKYGKNIKANQYLEKIFDISFSMPEHHDLQKLVDYYFDGRAYNVQPGREPINIKIHNFLIFLKFTNPRRVKKVLNKYQMFRDFMKMESSRFYEFPNIDMKNNIEKSFFETILVLYLIILHEFFQNEFDSFLNFEKMKQEYSRNLENREANFTEIIHTINSNFSAIPLVELKNFNFNNIQEQKCFWICFSPTNVEKVDLIDLLTKKAGQITTGKKNIDLLFYKYINAYSPEDLLKRHSSDASLFSIKKLIKDLL